jgi:hypothetical protein
MAGPAAGRPGHGGITRNAETAMKTIEAPRAKQAVPTEVGGHYSPEEVTRVLDLLKDVASVELKVVAPATGTRATVVGIGLDPVEAQPRQAFFFDTPDLALNRAGLIVRARRFPGGRADTVIKVRPVDPSTLDKALRRSASFKVELDAMPGGFVCSGSLKGTSTGQEVLDVTAGTAPLESLFSKEQLAYYEANAPAGVGMDSLVALGPTFLLRAKHQPKKFDRRLVVELWLYPDGSRILEVSTKAEPDEAFQVAAEFRAFLGKCGIQVTASDGTKTRSALEFFSKGLASAPSKG